jgi:replicative DNA helicase
MENWDDDMQTPTQGQAEFIVAKHRNGALGKIRLKFSAELGKFEDIDSYDSPFEFQSKLNKSDQEKLDDKDDMPF